MDKAHKQTDKIISDIEKRLKAEYTKAVKEVQAEILDYMKRFRIKDNIWRNEVKNGTKTNKEYIEWRKNQLAVGQRWEDLKNQLASDLHNVNNIAKSITEGYMPEVYALNFNYSTFQIETQSLVDTSFTLYDRQSVEKLFRDNPQMLPKPGKKVSALIAQGKEKLWNKAQLQSVMLQGIVQGDSIPKLAKRLAVEVGDSNYKNAVRNARTMATGTQNGGRLDAYKRAEDLGIDLQREWVATLDQRTRHEHRILDGQRVGTNEPFKVDGYELKFPGDPNAPAHLIYNCRCTTIAQIKGFEIDTRAYRQDPDFKGMTYEEWEQDKKKKRGGKGNVKANR